MAISCKIFQRTDPQSKRLTRLMPRSLKTCSRKSFCVTKRTVRCLRIRKYLMHIWLLWICSRKSNLSTEWIRWNLSRLWWTKWTKIPTKERRSFMAWRRKKRKTQLTRKITRSTSTVRVLTSWWMRISWQTRAVKKLIAKTWELQVVSRVWISIALMLSIQLVSPTNKLWRRWRAQARLLIQSLIQASPLQDKVEIMDSRHITCTSDRRPRLMVREAKLSAQTLTAELTTRIIQTQSKEVQSSTILASRPRKVVNRPIIWLRTTCLNSEMKELSTQR